MIPLKDRRFGIALALAFFTLVAAALRFWHLDAIPPGLHYDEAFNGLDAYRLASTPLREWPIFFNGNFGREPLLIYLIHLTQNVLGPSIGAVRLMPALATTLLTPALGWLGWEVGPSLGVRQRQRFALWSAIAILALLWSQIFAHYGIRASLFVLLETVMLAALFRAWRTQRLRWWVVAGVSAGLAFYTYLPVRLLPVMGVLMFVLLAWQRPRGLRKRLPSLLFAVALSAIVAAPLAIYFVQNPVAFTTRLGQVSQLDQGAGGALWDSTRAVLGMFFVRGDFDVRNNIPGHPALDPLMAVFWLLGALVLLIRIRRPGAQFLLLTGLIMLLPTWLSEHAPSFLRAIGILPILCLTIALGLETAASALEQKIGRARWVAAGAWAMLAISILLSQRAYFTQWATRPDLGIAWDVGFTELAGVLADYDSNDRVYLDPRGADHPTVRYLLLNDPDPAALQGFDGRVCVRVATDRPATYIVLAQEDARGANLLQSYLPAANAQPLLRDAAGETWALSLEQPANAPVAFPEMTTQPTDLSDGIQLAGYWLSQEALQAGQRLYVRLFWGAAAAPQKNYTAFAHLLRSDGAGGFLNLAGADRPPGNGSCPTNEWLPGEMIVDELEFVLSDALAPGEYYLEVGFYDPSSGQRLEVPGDPASRVLIGPLATAN